MEELKEVFGRFGFEVPPVAVKFTNDEPKTLKALGEKLDFCEMLKKAQQDEGFFATKENFTCIGPLLLGTVEAEPVFEQGRVGPRLGVFKDERANRRIYQYLPRLPKNSVTYVAFCPLYKSPFDPDLLIILAEVQQAEIILRAHSYSTGEMWDAKGTPVASCAWIYIYPYMTGRMNFTITGLGFGMKARRLFPEGKVLISIPWDKVPQLISNLKEMPWVPESFVIGPAGHKAKVKRILEELKGGR